jgi:hypothetical protein
MAPTKRLKVIPRKIITSILFRSVNKVENKNPNIKKTGNPSQNICPVKMSKSNITERKNNKMGHKMASPSTPRVEGLASIFLVIN